MRTPDPEKRDQSQQVKRNRAQLRRCRGRQDVRRIGAERRMMEAMKPLAGGIEDELKRHVRRVEQGP